MPRPKLDVIGKTFNYVTVVADTGERKGRAPLYLCRCVCGTEFLSIASNVAGGNKKSCGCKRGQAQIGVKRPWLSELNKQRAKHGGYKSKAYSIWRGMLQRCFNPNAKSYHRYGGRGITVCDRWMDFANFLEDMGEAPENLTIERVDNDKGYEPGNCVWAPLKVQANNRSDNVNVTHEGKTMTVAQWAEVVGIERKTLEYRIRAGWDAARALTTKSLINRKGI
jgi:hypothetical protein